MNEIINQDVYYPKDSDKVDVTLADFINNYPNREYIKILFLRVKEGHYQFGKKKVNISLNNNDQLVVKLQSKTYGIKEFIEKYSKSEFDKVDMKTIVEQFCNMFSMQNMMNRQANIHNKVKN